MTEPFYMVPVSVAVRKDVSPAAKLTYGLVFSRHSRKVQAPAVLDICDELEQPRRTITRHLSELTHAGLVGCARDGSEVRYAPLTEPGMATPHFSLDLDRTREREEEEDKRSSDSQPQATPAAVFAHWQTKLGHPRAKLDSKRRACIRAAIDTGYTLDELRKAIDGCAASAWHMGENTTRTRYDDIELILRDAKHIERFIGLAPKSDAEVMAERKAAAERKTKEIREKNRRLYPHMYEEDAA